MFEGKINAKVNRYGQTSTQQTRRMSTDDFTVIANTKVNGNAIRETAHEDRPTTRVVLTVHPDCFKA